ncbi:MAG: hypothetical protein QJR08_07745 [Bacillota bacterium]|nr:hypothetical protein [Bacillota bacterium]
MNGIWLAALLLGFVLGATLRPGRVPLRWNERLGQASLVVLLLSLGAQVGADPTVWRHPGLLAGRALLLAWLPQLGAVLVTRFLVR